MKIYYLIKDLKFSKKFNSQICMRFFTGNKVLIDAVSAKIVSLEEQVEFL
jgi:hypothetical protein